MNNLRLRRKTLFIPTSHSDFEFVSPGRERIFMVGFGCKSGIVFDDLEKYDVVDRAIAHFEKLAESGGTLIGQKIRDLVTVNGVRITVEDGTWGLVRASSNKPGLVVVVESPTSEDNMRAIFAEIDALLSSYKEVGDYDQKI